MGIDMTQWEKRRDIHGRLGIADLGKAPLASVQWCHQVGHRKVAERLMDRQERNQLSIMVKLRTDATLLSYALFSPPRFRRIPHQIWGTFQESPPGIPVFLLWDQPLEWP